MIIFSKILAFLIGFFVGESLWSSIRYIKYGEQKWLKRGLICMPVSAILLIILFTTVVYVDDKNKREKEYCSCEECYCNCGQTERDTSYFVKDLIGPIKQ